MRRNPFRLALVGAGLLAALAGAQGAGAQEPKTPTATRHRRRRRHRRHARHPGRDRHAARGRQRRRRRGRRGGVLGVTEPFSCGIGGGGFMVIRTAGRQGHDDRRPRDGPGRACGPTRSSRTALPLPFNDARYSGLSAGVPGTVDTWDEALRRYGTLSLAKALQPGIRVARDGFPVDQTFFDQTQGNVDYFDDVPSTAALYLDPDGTPRDVGTTLRNPDMARTYERIAKLGVRKGFYGGAVADAMVEAAAEPADRRGRQPHLAPRPDDDARRPGATTRSSARRRGSATAAWTSTAWARRPAAARPSARRSTSSRATRRSADARAGAAPLHRGVALLVRRPQRATSPTRRTSTCRCKGLLSDSFAAERRALISRHGGQPRRRPGRPVRQPGRPERGDPARLATGPGKGTSTTHLTVADAKGTVVSYTFTIESTGGNGIVVPGWGFLLNNELTDFNFDSTTHPNRADGGKRPRSSMAPTIVTRGGKPCLAIGSPGGSTIITTVLQTLIDRLDLGRTLPQAIAAPRVVAAQRRVLARRAGVPGLAGGPGAADDATGTTSARRARSAR